MHARTPCTASREEGINVAHEICSGLVGGATYDQEVTNLLGSGAKLSRDQAVALVEDAWEFYCPISLSPR